MNNVVITRKVTFCQTFVFLFVCVNVCLNLFTRRLVSFGTSKFILEKNADLLSIIKSFLFFEI